MSKAIAEEVAALAASMNDEGVAERYAAFGHVEPTFPESVGALRNQIRSVISSLPLAGYPASGHGRCAQDLGNVFEDAGHRSADARCAQPSDRMAAGAGRAGQCLARTRQEMEGAARRHAQSVDGVQSSVDGNLGVPQRGRGSGGRGCAQEDVRDRGQARVPNYAHLDTGDDVGAVRPGPRVETSSPPTSTGSFGSAISSRPERICSTGPDLSRFPRWAAFR